MTDTFDDFDIDKWHVGGKVICVSAYPNKWGVCTQTRKTMIDQVLTLTSVKIHSFYTELSFYEYPFETFNSVHYEPHLARSVYARVRGLVRRIF